MSNYVPDAPCLYFAVTDNGTLVDVNDRLCRKLGYRREELVGQKLDLIYTVSSRIFHQTHFFPLLKMQGFADEIFLTLRSREKEIVPVLINAERKTDGDKPVTVCAGVVVNNRKKFEDELVAAKKAAEAALQENTALMQAKEALQAHAEQLDQQMLTTRRQNEELKQFSRVVTHDLQEPLRKLFLFTSLILEKGEEEQESSIKKLAAIANQMRSVMSGLQQYVWLTDTALNIAPVDLNEVLQNAFEKIVGLHENIEISLKADDLPTIDADREQMTFLFEEIFANAVQFRKPDEGVRISVTVNRLLRNQFRSLPGKYKYTEYLRIEIKDNGRGMLPAYKDQALELFRRLHANSGRGVGLSLCKKIVENHNGNITLESAENEGTALILWLPLPKEKEENNPGSIQQKMKTNG